MAHRAELADPTGLISVMLVPVAAFVVTGVITTWLWEKPFDLGLVIWQAIVLWPIGAALLVAPALVVRAVRGPMLRCTGTLVVSAAGVASMLVVASSDDAQAGVGFLYAPAVGALGAAVLLLIDRRLRRGSDSQAAAAR